MVNAIKKHHYHIFKYIMGIPSVSFAPDLLASQLSIACVHGHADMVRDLLDVGAPLFSPNTGLTPMETAVKYKRLSVLVALLTANYNLRNRS
jgi:hypothetical protein